MPADRSARPRPSRVVPYETVLSQETGPRPPPTAYDASLAHLMSQTQQAIVPQVAPPGNQYPPHNHPRAPPPPANPPAQHAPPFYPPQYHSRAPMQPPPHSLPQQPPAPPQPLIWHGLQNSNAPRPNGPTSQPPNGSNAPNQSRRGQRREDHPPTSREKLTEDEQTRLVQTALRWSFVRDQGSQQDYWQDVAKSFERVSGRGFASARRRIESLEETYRKAFAARDAEGGFKGNNNTDLARTMRAWLAYRDEEDIAKKDKEEDMKALEVRRNRLHQAEAERFGLTDVCNYESRFVTEEEEIGPLASRLRDASSNRHALSNGDHANPVSLDEEPGEDRNHAGIDQDGNQPDALPSGNASDQNKQLTLILDLLRKRQKEERLEADIRREEQMVLNKRLKIMEEHVQNLSKLVGDRALSTSEDDGREISERMVEGEQATSHEQGSQLGESNGDGS